MAMHTVLLEKGMGFFQNKLSQFIVKILGILNSKKESHFNNYMVERMLYLVEGVCLQDCGIRRSQSGGGGQEEAGGPGCGGFS